MLFVAGADVEDQAVTQPIRRLSKQIQDLQHMIHH